ncbi:hypothetical protein [Nocardia harenae]|uniref:hypothetical protein n=1 Tax=Nocardia harenae TaxID=358707 RepID=UPI00082D1825|nr:hypothetical protein [Nocardia harenae]
MSTPTQQHDEVAAAQFGYYAARIGDETEARWRADYATAVHLRYRAGDAWSNADAAPVRAEADRIEQSWTADPEIRARWEELDRFRAELPELFVHAPTHPDLPIAQRPTGTDTVSWRSRMQAMQLEGLGSWPDPAGDRVNPHNGRTTFEPLSWDRSDPTNPNHHTGAASHDERVMRADFARFHQLREQVRTESGDDEQLQDAQDMSTRIGLRWSLRGDELGTEFRAMSGSVIERRGEPDWAAVAAAELRADPQVPEIEARSAEQVTELLDRDRPHPAARAGTRSALAGHRSRNALARGTDRDTGFDR